MVDQRNDDGPEVHMNTRTWDRSGEARLGGPPAPRRVRDLTRAGTLSTVVIAQ